MSCDWLNDAARPIANDICRGSAIARGTKGRSGPSALTFGFEQHVGQLAVIGCLGVLRFNAGNLGLKLGDAVQQLFLRIAVERLLCQEACRVTALAGKIVFHCIAASRCASLLSMGSDPRGGEVW